jgi:hypothetical protein
LGYKVPVRTVTFDFPDAKPGDDLRGLEVVFRVGLPIATYVELSNMAAEAFAKKATLEKLHGLFLRVAEIGLVSWNIPNGKGMLPATPEAFVEKIPAAIASRLVGRYLKEVGALSGPLATTSASGRRSAGRPKSTSQPSSPEL